MTTTTTWGAKGTTWGAKGTNWGGGGGQYTIHKHMVTHTLFTKHTIHIYTHNAIYKTHY